MIRVGIERPLRRRTPRRIVQQLGELGRLEFRTLQDGGEVDGWLEEFLGLESSGWKSREGHALALSDDQRTFVCRKWD